MKNRVRRLSHSPDSGGGIMMNRMQENDYQAMKQRLVTICEVQAGTISATEAADVSASPAKRSTSIWMPL